MALSGTRHQVAFPCCVAPARVIVRALWHPGGVAWSVSKMVHFTENASFSVSRRVCGTWTCAAMADDVPRGLQEGSLTGTWRLAEGSRRLPVSTPCVAEGDVTPSPGPVPGVKNLRGRG